MNNFLKSLFFVVAFLNVNLTYGQVKLAPSFLQTLNEAKIAFAEPVENLYKNSKRSRNSLLTCHLAIKNKKGDMEIRYLIKPDNESTNQWLTPHIAGMSTASHLASNLEESSQIVVHTVRREDLSLQFNADWGATFFFTPKKKFSMKKHCKMLVLYKEGSGLVYIFYLFDKISEELDKLAYPVRFQE